MTEEDALVTDDEHPEEQPGDGVCDDCQHAETSHGPGSGLCAECDCVGFIDEAEGDS